MTTRVRIHLRTATELAPDQAALLTDETLEFVVEMTHAEFDLVTRQAALMYRRAFKTIEAVTDA